MINFWKDSTLLLLLILFSSLKIKAFDTKYSAEAAELIETHSCANFDVPATVENASCGYVTVPEFHDRATKTSFKLAFIRLKSTGNNSDSTPLIMEQGGPGASSFHRVRHFTPEGILLPLQKQRDILLIEQRGAYYSRPYLQCDRAEFPSICKERLEGEGINLDAFNMVQHAHDIALVTQTLGYDRFNYYGTSYASQLALYLLRQYPQRLRTIILDATIATDSDIGFYQLESFSRALRNIFAACDRDRFCQQNYPNLEQELTHLLEKLERDPLSISISIEGEEKEHYYFLNGQTFAFFLRDFLYDAHQYAPQLPRLIYDLNREDFTLFKNIYRQRLKEAFPLANGMRFATICAAPNPPIPSLNLKPTLLLLQRITIISGTLVDFCSFYPVTPLANSVYEPIRSDIPSLILHGEYDPITPLPYGEYVAHFLSKAYIFEYPGLGHGVLEQGNCPIIMALEFLDRPQQSPDRTCIAKMGQWGVWENVLSPNSELNERKP
ncbi:MULTISPECIES: alpha/beta fold hydrolase [Spirulina sp. CCY15215]|uniref:alpha/beta fold hydrolase n=1 Tax=Spirulina sp. CCY15215 TaxID=2767591 RepID=UPI00194E8E90|nr:alpha/beta fold hydrolase [Spirulina major]